MTSSQRPCSFRAARSSFGVHCRSETRPAAAGVSQRAGGAPCPGVRRAARQRGSPHASGRRAQTLPTQCKRLSPAGSRYTALDDEWAACSCTRDAGIFSKPATKQRFSVQPKARVTANRISERKRNVLPGGERGRKRDYHRWWANPDTRVYSCLFGRRLLSTKVYHQEGMLLTVFTESLKLPLSWNPDKESHLLCSQLLLLLPSSGAVSTSPSPQSGRLYLSTVPHTCGTSCQCDACARLCAPSHQILARTLCWVYRKCRPGAGREQKTRYITGI